MPATTKQALEAVTQTEFARLWAVIDPISDTDAARNDADGTSIKDIVAHRAHWIDLFLGWYADGQAGKIVHFPAEGYKWSDLKRYNAALRERQRDLGWTEARDMLSDRHEKLSALIHGLSETALYSAPMKGARNDWTTGRWAEAAGPSHYRSATKYIRARAKSWG